jgi:Ca-activated chloride channel family protein
MLTLKVRYKDPDGSQSKLLEAPFVDPGRSFSQASSDFRFAASVAEFGMILRDSPYKGSASLDGVLELAEQNRGADRGGYRSEFIQLVRQARLIKRLQ